MSIFVFVLELNKIIKKGLISNNYIFSSFFLNDNPKNQDEFGLKSWTQKNSLFNITPPSSSNFRVIGEKHNIKNIIIAPKKARRAEDHLKIKFHKKKRLNSLPRERRKDADCLELGLYKETYDVFYQ